jgi:hypothetical protein
MQMQNCSAVPFVCRVVPRNRFPFFFSPSECLTKFHCCFFRKPLFMFDLNSQESVSPHTHTHTHGCQILLQFWPFDILNIAIISQFFELETACNSSDIWIFAILLTDPLIFGKFKCKLLKLKSRVGDYPGLFSDDNMDFFCRNSFEYLGENFGHLAKVTFSVF